MRGADGASLWSCRRDSGALVGDDLSSAFPPLRYRAHCNRQPLYALKEHPTTTTTSLFPICRRNKAAAQHSAVVSALLQLVQFIKQHPGVADHLIHALESWAPVHRLRLQPCRPGMQRLATVTEREMNRQVANWNVADTIRPLRTSKTVWRSMLLGFSSKVAKRVRVISGNRMAVT